MKSNTVFGGEKKIKITRDSRVAIRKQLERGGKRFYSETRDITKGRKVTDRKMVAEMQESINRGEISEKKAKKIAKELGIRKIHRKFSQMEPQQEMPEPQEAKEEDPGRSLQEERQEWLARKRVQLRNRTEKKLEQRHAANDSVYNIIDDRNKAA